MEFESPSDRVFCLNFLRMPLEEHHQAPVDGDGDGDADAVTRDDTVMLMMMMMRRRRRRRRSNEPPQVYGFVCQWITSDCKVAARRRRPLFVAASPAQWSLRGTRPFRSTGSLSSWCLILWLNLSHCRCCVYHRPFWTSWHWCPLCGFPNKLDLDSGAIADICITIFICLYLP